MDERVAIIRATPEEDLIKKFVIEGMKEMTLILSGIMQSTMMKRGNPRDIVNFKVKLMELYFFYARPKIAPVNASMTIESMQIKNFASLYKLDNYMANPSNLKMKEAMEYANKMRELFEYLGLFEIEKIGKS